MADGIKIFGAGELEKGMGNFEKNLHRRMFPRMTRATLKVTAEAQKRIRGKRATNPPEVLGVVTGRGKGSILPNVSKDGLMGTVGTNVEYMLKHEIGFAVPKRPFMAPGLEASKEFIFKELGAGVDAALRDI